MDIRDIIIINITHLGTLPYIKFDPHTRAFIVSRNHFIHCSIPEAIRCQLPIAKSFQSSLLSSPSSNRQFMASHNIWEASLFSECVISVLAEEAQCLECRQTEAAQQHVLELEWEIQGEGGLGVCACRLADLAHHLDCVGTYRPLKELWTEITSKNRLYQRNV